MARGSNVVRTTQKNKKKVEKIVERRKDSLTYWYIGTKNLGRLSRSRCASSPQNPEIPLHVVVVCIVASR